MLLVPANLAGYHSASSDLLSLEGVTGATIFSGSIRFPSVPTRTKSTWGSPRNTRNTFWGAWTGRTATDTFYNPQTPDCLRPRSFDLSSINTNPSNTAVDVAGETTAYTGSQAYEIAWVFSLDNISGSAAGYQYSGGNAGYRTAGTSVTAVSGYTASLAAGLDRFTTVLHGGFDGLNITEREPFRNSKMSAISAISELKSYELYSLRKAINIVSSPDDVQMNAITIPGITEEAVTDFLLDAAERRADTLAIIDLENDYTPIAERDTDDTDSSSLGSVTSAVSSLKSRNLNSSYAAAFYPWVQVSDNLNGGQLVWLPSSVAGLGAMAKSQATSELWFAPAGFNRGGLGSLGGSRGPRVLQARQRLDSKERDSLYEVNINPIATFPAEGVVIFGQKTLQADASALDRINVRRLVLFLKSQVSTIARNLLFDQNVQSTWNRFKSQVNPILSSVQSRYGLSDYKLILDDTTTTADLIDRNIMYAKIYIKPARAIEYIVVDFVITKTGADFV